jgi:hypothetical protein
VVGVNVAVITVFEIYQNVTRYCEVDVFSHLILKSNSRPALINTYRVRGLSKSCSRVDVNYNHPFWGNILYLYLYLLIFILTFFDFLTFLTFLTLDATHCEQVWPQRELNKFCNVSQLDN